MWQLPLITLALLSADPVADSAAPTVSVQTMDGRTLQGDLIALDSKQLTLRHDGSEEQIAVAQLMSVSPNVATAKTSSADSASPIVVRLVDDSQLGAVELTSTQSVMQLKLDADTQAEVPMSGVEWVRFPSPSAEIAAEWERIMALEAKSDVLVVRKEQALDYHEGVIRAVKPEVVEFELDGEVLPIKRAKVEGIRYFHPQQRELPAAVCSVVRGGGMQLLAADLKLDKGQVAVQTPAGLQIALPWTDIERLDFSRGKIVFLSDLDWDTQLYERQTYFGGKRPIDEGLDLYPPQRDRALEGGALELDRRSFTKGLALHSRTRLVYRLPGAYRRFIATAGIDDRTGNQGAARLVIEGDGRELYAADLTGSDAPQPLDLDISGVKRLSILVDFGKDLDISDHVDLVEARIVK